MRSFLSKCIAGGLSAGVVLLWWPVLFQEVDTVTSWLVRGVVWTVSFELLLLALEPFERALWETSRGERIVGRVGAAGSRLHSGSPRRRIGRLSALAAVALSVPVVLLSMGLGARQPAHADAPATAPIKVIRVQKVVRPVTVKRVVERVPVATAPALTNPQQETPAPTAAPKPATPKSGDRAVVGDSAPVEREAAPEAAPQDTEEPSEGAESEAAPVG